MRQLSRVESAIFLLGGLLMVIGAGTSLLAWAGAPYVFALGALCFTAMQMKQRYDGQNVTIRRLRRMMLISDVLFLVSALLMFASQRNIFGLDHITYKRMRICFKMRKFFFPIQDYVVHLQRKQRDNEEVRIYNHRYCRPDILC